MAEPLGLFPELEPLPREDLSPDRRRAVRQRQAIAGGAHPLAVIDPRIRLHADAPRPTGPEDRGLPGPRCGTCFYRVAGRYPKCCWDSLPGESPKQWPRASHGATTDVRSWWPACTDYFAVVADA